MAWPRKRSRRFDGPGSRVSSAPPSFMDGSLPSSVQRRWRRSRSGSLDSSLVETMYAHCIYCHADLGNNSVIETFPVGRRLAFDAAKARLWAVCRKCERWFEWPMSTWTRSPRLSGHAHSLESTSLALDRLWPGPKDSDPISTSTATTLQWHGVH